MRWSAILTLLGALTAPAGTPSVAGDWPQILGPHRNGAAAEESIRDTFPASGLPTVWERPVGRGLAGVAVAEGTAVLFHRLGNQEVVEALDAATGDVRWKSEHATTYTPSFIEDDGPRCVPVIHRGRVYVYGAQGVLKCLNLKSGETLWLRQTHQDFGAREGYFGAGSSPIVVGDRLLVNVGGRRPNTAIVAFDLDSGETLWSAVADDAGYSSPVTATIDGTLHVIFVTRLNAVSVDPANGKVRFRFPFGQRGPTVNGANPVILGDKLFLTASYGVGAVLADLSATGAKELWRRDDVMSSQYTTPVMDRGLMFGIDGRQDVPPANLRCFDPLTGKIHWTEEAFGYATLIKADGKLLIQKTNGELVLAEPNSERYVENSRTRVLNGTVRALPALADGRYFVRNERVLKCVDLRKSR